MKIFRNNLTWTFIGLVVFALVLYLLNQAKQPEQIVVEVKVKPDTSESILLKEALDDPENLIAKVLEDETSNQVSNQDVVASSISEPATDLPNNFEHALSDEPILYAVDNAENASALDPIIQTSLKNSEPYADEAYVNPNSTLNQSTIKALRALRDKRFSSEK